MPGLFAIPPSFASVIGPMTASIIGRVIEPGLKIQGISPLISMTVDSIPTRHGPASIIPTTRLSLPNARWTCSARVGEISLLRFALGAARGTPAALIIALATAWSGQRTATVFPPAVTMSGMFGLLGSTIESGPGQKALASFCAASGYVFATCFTSASDSM